MVYIAWSCLCYIFHFSYDFYLMLFPQLPTFLTREREIIWWNLNTLCWSHTNQPKCQLTMLSSHSWAFSLVLKYVQGLYPFIMTFFFFSLHKLHEILNLVLISYSYISTAKLSAWSPYVLIYIYKCMAVKYLLAYIGLTLNKFLFISQYHADSTQVLNS